LTLTSASDGSAEDHDESSGGARSRRRREQMAQTLLSGAATKSSTMSGIGMATPVPAGCHVSPPSADTTIGPPRPTRGAGPASRRSGRAGGMIVARV
jgi:hypothetical protein